MSQNQLTHAQKMRADGKFPIVLRFASMTPADAFGMIAHGERTIGNLDHVDPARTHINKIVTGSVETAKDLVAMSREMSELNLRSNLLGLEKMGRKQDLAAAKRTGLRQPWNEQKKSRGPLREAVLTVHRDFFRADEDTPKKEIFQFLDDQGLVARFDKRKMQRFARVGHAFLVEEFGEMLAYERIDVDEQSIHFQAILAQVSEEKPSKRYALGRKLWKLTDHRCIGDRVETKLVDGKPKRFVVKRGYEVAQDVVGDFFDQPEHRDMGIVRGEARAAESRRAKIEAKDIEEGLKAAGDVAIPRGSKQAQAMWLIRKAMAEKIAEKGSAEKVRKDDRQTLALDYLEALGVISPDVRHEAKTRRERQALLDLHAVKYGTSEQIIEKPEAVADLVMEEMKARAEAAKKDEEARQKAARKGFLDKVRREQAAAEKAAIERRAQEDRERAEWFKREDKERAEKAKELAAKEVDLVTKETELTEKETKLRAFAKSLGEMRDKLVSYAKPLYIMAKQLGMLKDPEVKHGMEAIRELGADRD